MKQYGIEEEYLLPGGMKTRGMNYFEINKKLVNRYFLFINKEEKEIKNSGVYKYLKMGEKEILPGSKTLSAKSVWWRFTYRKPAELISPCGYGDTIFCAINKAKAVSSNSFTEIRLKDSDYEYPLFVFLNSFYI